MTSDTTGKLFRGSARLCKSNFSKNSVSAISLTNRFVPTHDKSNSPTLLKKSFKNKEETDKIPNSSKKTDNLNYNHIHLKTSGIIFCKKY